MVYKSKYSKLKNGSKAGNALIMFLSLISSIGGLTGIIGGLVGLSGSSFSSSLFVNSAFLFKSNLVNLTSPFDLMYSSQFS
ncbi:UNVERIFIED_CONTAM: hypothetical protein O8I53_13295 [Campylobacter lari]